MSGAKLSQWQDRFNALSERERLMVFVAALVVCWGLIEVLFLGGLRSRQPLEAQNVASLREQVDQLNSRQAALNQQISNGTLQAAPDQEADLLKRNRAADLALRGEGGRYLAPTRDRQVWYA